MSIAPLTTSATDHSTRRGALVARLSVIATTATVAALGPGLAIAQAGIYRNHNEVLVDPAAGRSSRRAAVVARLSVVASTATVVALGPGLAMAHAGIWQNHNDVLV